MNARHVAALALVAVVAMLSGCSGPPEPVETTPAFSSEDEAFAAAEDTYRAYVDALNQVDLSDPATFEPVFALTTGELASSDRTNFSRWHADGYALHGTSVVETIERLDATVAGGTAEVTLGACYNVAEVDVRDGAGNSVVDANRPAVQRLEITLLQPDATERVLIQTIEPHDAMTC